MSQHDDDFMSAGEAAAYLGVTRQRVSKYIKDGRLSAFRREINPKIKWLRRSEVQALKSELNLPKKLTARAA